MQLNGYSPDTIVYNSLLDGLFKARKVNDGCQLFEKMVQNGKKGQFVDGVTYSIVVLQLCKDGLLEEALGLVEEMERRGFTVDLITISSLVIGLYKEGRWDWTDKLMKHIRDGNPVPTVLKWKVDMEASLKNPQRNRKDYTPLFPSKGDLSEIMSLIKSAESTMDADLDSKAARAKEDKNLSTDADQYTGKLSVACKLFEIFTFNALGKASRIDEVNKLFEQMKSSGINPDVVTFNTLIEVHSKAGRLKDAYKFLKIMLGAGCTPNHVTDTTLDFLGKEIEKMRYQKASMVRDKDD
ncbi:hypothetical protein ACFX13_001207 [Malus domestica]